MTTPASVSPTPCAAGGQRRGENCGPVPGQQQLATGARIHIANLAKQAHAAVFGRVMPVKLVTAWRRDEMERIVGVRSLKHCAPEDYQKLREHFHRVRMIHLQDRAIETMAPR